MGSSVIKNILNHSILDDIKKYIGPAVCYTVFDPDIMMNINSAFFTLWQLGVGPKIVFSIVSNKTVWKEFSDDEGIISATKQYVYLRVRNIFDPPTSSAVMQAYDSQIKELEWRLREMTAGSFSDDEDEDCDNECCSDTDDFDDCCCEVVTEEEIRDLIDKVFDWGRTN